MPRYRPRPRFDAPIETYLEIDGVENTVEINVNYNPAEPENNAGESLEIESVLFHGWDVQSLLPPDDKEALRQRMFDEHVNCDPGDYEDHCYQDFKERQMEERE